VDPAGGSCIESWAADSLVSHNLGYHCATDGIANGGRNTIVADNIVFGNGKKADGRLYCGVVARYADSRYTGDNTLFRDNRAYDDAAGTSNMATATTLESPISNSSPTISMVTRSVRRKSPAAMLRSTRSARNPALLRGQVKINRSDYSSTYSS